MNISRIAALGFINQYKIKKYTFPSLSKVIKDMGYAIIEIDADENESLVIKACEKSYFIFESGPIKYVAIPNNTDEKEKCRLCSLCAYEIYSSHNSLLCKNTNHEDFDMFLQQVLCSNSVFSHLNRNIFEYASGIVLFVITICFSLSALFLEKSLDSQMIMPEFKQEVSFLNVDSTQEEIEEVISVFNPVDISQSTDSGMTNIIDDFTVIKENTEDNAIVSHTSSYYVTKSGTKYHLEGCSYIKDLSQCTPLNENELGEYQPCKRCIK